MPKLRKSAGIKSGSFRNHYSRKSQGLRLDKGLLRFFHLQHLGNPLRFVRHGKRKNQDHHQNQNYSYMSKLREAVVSFLYETGNQSGCHQLPERSFFWKKHQFPVCARCTGVCIGHLAAIIANFFTDISCAVSFLYLGIMGLDWLLQEVRIKASNNYRRLFTGVLGGFGLYNLYCLAIKKLYRRFKK